MELFEAIEKRHSYRGEFKDREVPREDLVKIVEAGIKAPSGKNAQTTEFVIITDKEKIDFISDLIEKPLIKTAKAIIACVMDPEPVYFGLSFGPEDCAAAVENMLLTITALGYASVWIDGAIRVKERNKAIDRLLKIPQGKNTRIILPVGIPAEQSKQPEKKAFDQRAFFNQYGG